MVDLDQFPEDVYRTLIALPYRVGLYVSLSDRTGGKDSASQELAALENVVTFYVEDTLKSEFSQSIMLATLQHKAYWAEWSEGVEDVPTECTYIANYLVDCIDERKLAGFKNNLLEIAMAVALAYRETAATTGFFAKLRNLLTFRSVKISSDETSTDLNISEAERIAINHLAEKLGLSQKVA